MLQSHTIGRLAKLANVNVETIRYYQRISLIEEPPKPPEGYRLYSNNLVDRIRFIKRAQKQGFALKEIAELLALGSSHCEEAKAVAVQKRAVIIKKIEELSALRDSLDRLIESCEIPHGEDWCALIESLLLTPQD